MTLGAVHVEHNSELQPQLIVSVTDHLFTVASNTPECASGHNTQGGGGGGVKPALMVHFFKQLACNFFYVRGRGGRYG